MTMLDERMLTPTEYAARRGCTPAHLANERSRGLGLPYVKYGNRVLYRSADVLQDEKARLVMPVRAMGNGGLL